MSGAAQSSSLTQVVLHAVPLQANGAHGCVAAGLHTPAPSHEVTTREAGPTPGSAAEFAMVAGDRVFFDYDQHSVRGDATPILDKQAQWLQRYPQVMIRIEGNADERGTREYNLALGARRANAVKEYLVSQGVSTGRVETISYGKERPICTDSNEACWAQNRRGVTTITGGANS